MQGVALPFLIGWALLGAPEMPRGDGIGAAPQPERRGQPDLPKIDSARIESSITKGVQLLLAMQEADDTAAVKALPEEPGQADGKNQWPYEGVYRVNRQIPVGYRVGGTGIAILALAQAPGYAEDAARKEAVRRGVSFIIASTKHELMNPDYDSTYDVRGWGYTYGLAALLKLRSMNALPNDLGQAALDAVESKSDAEAIDKTIIWCIDCIQRTEIPQVGGWNYSRPGGKSGVSPMSPFMTGPTLQALFQAKSMGFEVKTEVVDRAIAALLRARTPTGSYTYAGDARENPEPVPGAVGRMLVSEVTLSLCGKSDMQRVRAAIDAFFVHWEWLDRRRAQNGTHIPPYQIAPYYFYYAHYYAAQAIEMLPRRDREEYRRRLSELLWKNQLGDGSWNDRVFPRSANYGTAMSIMALMMPETPKPAEWKGEK
ncbi:MAG: hypothetical protein AB7G11_01390 [Phycisphaerales bacterium]